MENVKTKSLGEKRVRIDFNTTGDSYIDVLKTTGAKFIDEINKAAPNPNWTDEQVREWARLKALAMTHIETATMYAVKAATV